MAKAKKKVLIISHDKIGENMAGPGIRYHHMAEFLSKEFDVTIGFFDPTYLPNKSFKRSYSTQHVDVNGFRKHFLDKAVIIAMWLSQEMMDYCHQNNIYMVFDAYAPVPVENLALYLYSGDPVTTHTDYSYRQSYNSYEKFFQYGDLFLFSNRRQIDFWMGYVFGTSAISVSNYQKRPLFDRFIQAPMGIDSKANLRHTKSVIKGTIPGIKRTDKVILWTGGIWNWFDAQTLIRSMKLIENKHPEIKLVFFGVKHPNPDVPAMQEASKTIDLSKELNLLNKTVFIHEDWVPYDERINYLLEADAAVNTTKDTIESEMSHRTRVLDHFLANLPTLATAGDYLSDEVINKYDLGIVVSPENEAELAQAIIDIVEEKNNSKFRKNVQAIRQEYDWHNTLSSLNDNLRNDLSKLPFVEVKKPLDPMKNRLHYRIAKKVLPLPVKKAIIRAIKYGR